MPRSCLNIEQKKQWKSQYVGSQISAVKQSENHQSGGSDPVYKQKIHEANHTKMGFGPFKILLLFGLSVRPENPENTEKVS